MARGDIKKIFAEHWEEFLEIYGHKVRGTGSKKILGCGSFENGYAKYQCENCGSKKKVAFRCRSRFCGSCGKVYIDDRAENMTAKLVRTKHRHMVFTISEELRGFFQKDRKLLGLLPQCAAEVIKSWWHEQSETEKYTPGIVAVIHTFGRDLKWNPHAHLLVTEGAAGEETVWKGSNFIPYKMLRKRWQKLILDALEKEIGKREFKKLKNKMYKEKTEGFYVYAKGEIKSEKAAIQYVGRYTGRPPIAESRIISYDGRQISFWYKRHEDNKIVEETIDAIEFIKRLIIHIPEEQFKMIRYYGIYSQHAKKREKLIKFVSEKVKELRKNMRKWRIRIMFGYDPTECEKCGGKMTVVDVFYKEYGSIIELYQKRIEAKVKAEIKKIEEMDEAIRAITDGRIVPIFV